ncbi:MAG: glycosyltransferase family 2 protein [Lachnospiraceae bacterium]|nr:glycosyltransferase family 2 protein [Lachnospiraceae bacterium]
MSKVSIVIPVYYNADTLIPLYHDMKAKILDKLDYELVFVDDGSGDDSWNIMNQIKEMDSNVVLVKLSRNFGEHAALLAGLSTSTGDCAVTKQADLQEDSEIILEMYERWKNGYKVVLAVREKRDEGFVKKFFARLYYMLIRSYVNKQMPLQGCDCYLLDRQVIGVLEMLDERNSSLTLQVLWTGFKSDNVYIHRRNREIGKSRWTLKKKLRLVMDSLMSFSEVPIRIMSGVGLLFFIIACVLAVLVVLEYFLLGTPMIGWTSLMCVALLSFGIMMLAMGVLGEYIWRTLDASRNRPPFLIDEIRK